MTERIRSTLDIVSPPITVEDDNTGQLAEVCFAEAGVVGIQRCSDMKFLVAVPKTKLDELGATALPGAVLRADMNSSGSSASELEVDLSGETLVGNFLSNEEFFRHIAAMNRPLQD